jgi:hypothetical protein
MGLAEHVARMEEISIAYINLFGKLKENRPLLSCRRGWQDNIKINFIETGYEVVN